MFLKDTSKSNQTPSYAQGADKGDSKPQTSGVPSIISADLKIIGDLKSSGDIQVDGVIEGDIDSRLLIIGEGARIEGSITADQVRVSGTVHGQIKAKSVTLDKTAKVVGDVIHENLTMEAGAFLEGGVRRLESVASPSTSKVAPIRPAGSGTTSGPTAGSTYGEATQSSIV